MYEYWILNFKKNTRSFVFQTNFLCVRQLVYSRRDVIIAVYESMLDFDFQTRVNSCWQSVSFRSSLRYNRTVHVLLYSIAVLHDKWTSNARYSVVQNINKATVCDGFLYNRNCLVTIFNYWESVSCWSTGIKSLKPLNIQNHKNKMYKTMQL